MGRILFLISASKIKCSSFFRKSRLEPSSTIEANTIITAHSHSYLNAYIILQQTLLNFHFSVTIEISSRISYAAWFKLKLVRVEKENGDHTAGRELNVDEKCAMKLRVKNTF